jgi:exodeoxyribonuclease VII large subunit
VLSERRDRAFGRLVATLEARLDRSYQLLHAFSYQSVLKRGFALVRDAAGHPLRSAAAITSGTRLDIEFADGRVGAVAEGGAAPVERAQPASPVRPAAKPRKPGGGGSQGSLFG